MSNINADKQELVHSRRQLKIKSSVVSRLLKEHNLYRKETTEQQIKVDKLVADAADEWDIKNGRKILDESNRMIADSAARLGKAVGDLRDLLVSVKGIEEITETEEFVTAETVLEEASI